MAVEGDPSDRTTVPAPRRALVFFDEAGPPQVRRTRHRPLPGMAQEAGESIERLGQYALDMVDSVDQARVELDLAPADDTNAARYRDARFVVPIDIGAHSQLALVLCRVEQLANALGVLDRVAAAGNSTADRAGLDPPSFDPNVHLGRCGDEKLALAEVDQCAVGCGIGVAQPLEDHARQVGAGIGEELS